jgi:GNAT superfamily N-acetyltransferase
MVELSTLNNSNFHHFINLLKMRGDAPENYYRWKYLEQPSPLLPIGFIAYLNTEPVGCIGIVNRTLCTEDGGKHPATWFADWFVHSDYRAFGIGKLLIEKVANLTPYGFGMPGPEKARTLTAEFYPMHLIFSKKKCILRPYQYGLKIYRDKWFKRILRGLKYGLTSTAKSRALKTQLQLKQGLPSVDVWQSVLRNRSESFFLRDSLTLQWFGNLQKVNKRFSFWHIHQDFFFAVGMTEMKTSGLCVARLLDFETPEQLKPEEVLSQVLRIQKVDMLEYYVKGDVADDASHHIVYCTSSNVDKFHLTSFDKESDWISLT